MKILIIHYKFYKEGGPETYLFNIRNLLKRNGQEIIDFSINFDKNEYSKYEQYFPKLIIGTKEFHFHKLNLTIFQKVKIFRNIIYNFEVKKKLQKLITETNPDISYVLIYRGKLSPSIFDVLKRNNVPVIHRISDFSLLCLNNLYLRKNNICRKCDESFIYGLFFNCSKNPFQTLAEYFSHQFFFIFNKQKSINTIVCPSAFTVNLFKENKRFKENRIIHLPSIVKNDFGFNFNKEIIKKRFIERTFSFWGRVDDDKGIIYFIKAIEILNKKNFYVKAKILGINDGEYSKYIENYIFENKITNISLFKFMEKQNVLNEIENSIASVIPSIWYDNMPNSLIESQSKGIPTIASNIGSFPELIKDGSNGFLFEMKNEKMLASKMLELTKSFDLYKALSLESFNWANGYCSEEFHYKILEEEINRLVYGNIK